MEERKAMVSSFLPSYLICIDEEKNGALSGKVYTGAKQFSDISFEDLPQMLVKIDEICDLLNCPMAWNENRAAKQPENKKVMNKEQVKGVLSKMRNFDTESRKGNKATFILNINFRQNASWQGTVRWVEKKQLFKFRSALELIKYIDEVCAQGYEAEVIDADEKAM